MTFSLVSNDGGPPRCRHRGERELHAQHVAIPDGKKHGKTSHGVKLTLKCSDCGTVFRFRPELGTYEHGPEFEFKCFVEPIE